LGDTQCEITGWLLSNNFKFVVMNGRNDIYNSKQACGALVRLHVSIVIPDQETAIMHKLQNAILESYRTLTEVQDLCAELDW
jgi:hypothetical protein